MYFIVIITGLVLCYFTTNKPEEIISQERNVVKTIDTCDSVQQKSAMLLGDPYILNNNGAYYLYGTSANDGIEVYKSTDLKVWNGPCGATDGLALHKNDVWGEKKFWAPEVYKINGTYYMFFSVDLHVAVATSNSPTGPFIQENKKAFITNRNAIDNHLFIDGDKKYIYYVSFEPKGLEVWCAELEDDLMSIKDGTILKCISQSQPWECVEAGSVNEGPFILKNGNYYYLIYSGNGYTSQDYGLGFTVSNSPKGPWIKHPGNPFFQKPGELVGVGHCSFFTDKNQNLKMVYHSHFDKENIHPRRVHINNVSFVEDKNYDYKVLEIDTSDINSQVKHIK